MVEPSSAVAYAAMRLGVPARIFVPVVSSEAKTARIRAYGAHLTVTGDRYADALAAAEEWMAESGALSVHAFDQRETLLGPGTLGRELSTQAPDLDTVLTADVYGAGEADALAAVQAAIAALPAPAASPEPAKKTTENRHLDEQAS